MATPSIKFKKLLFANDKNTRSQILYPLMNWLRQQTSVDSMASSCYATIQEAYQVNSWADDKSFKDHHLRFSMPNYDSCVSFQEIVKAKLGVPKKNIEVIIKDAAAPPRKAIPKKIRGECWKIQFGDSIKGYCYCCKKELDVFDDWHAGHIVSHSNGGPDTSQNLRPLCGSCNFAMGTENMDAFKGRCYPN
jgi:hypothetical protein